MSDCAVEKFVKAKNRRNTPNKYFNFFIMICIVLLFLK